MKRSRRTSGPAWRGWSIAGHYSADPSVPSGPSAWDLLLSELELTEKQAVSMLSGDVALTPALGRLIDFAEKFSSRRFVPEAVLRMIGVAVLEDEAVLSTGPGRDRRMGMRTQRRVVRVA
jgi:hypothetical protein